MCKDSTLLISSMIFISHALPEDNEFTRWLALRLAKEGYPIWCDLTKLLGGEDFWRDIQDAIKNRTTKFLFVLSRNSNEKGGVLKELALATRVGKNRNDFIIPLKIDDLPSDDTTIELVRLNSVDFLTSWTAGFKRLLEKLEKDRVPKDERFNPSTVASWWRDQQRQQSGVQAATENCACNWFKISDLPETIYLHSLDGAFKGEEKELPIGIPNYRYKSGVFCFEAAASASARLRDGHDKTITHTEALQMNDFQYRGHSQLKIDKSEAKNIVTNLLRRAFEMRCLEAGLKEYNLAGDARCFYFAEGILKGEKVHYYHLDGHKAYRQMTGRQTLLPRDGHPRHRIWHFALQGKLIRWPELAFAITSHVVFSENGELIKSKARQHSARRKQCKMWHNDTWLDRLLAAMFHLHDPDSTLFISVPCGSGVGFSVQTKPLLFESPVVYDVVDPAEVPDGPVNDDDGFEFLDDDDDDDDLNEESAS